MLKRLFDIAATALAVLALIPVLLPVAIILRFTGEGDIFYSQRRIGRNGKNFRILKFATMLRNSPNLPGGDITTGNDPRILPVGRFLRRTKINELPQLFNVLLGDMSLIGPRPLTARVVAMFPESHWRAVRHLRPGLSGISSIIFRDEEDIISAAPDREEMYANVIVPYKVALEGWYADNQSFWTDMKLIYLTVAAVLRWNADPSRFFTNLPQLPRLPR
jgi:lipopolysaccharide/colanic/teichoic acid biosynthesis glycosyltransferase